MDSVPKTLALASKLRFESGAYIYPCEPVSSVVSTFLWLNQQATAGGRNGQVSTWNMEMGEGRKWTGWEAMSRAGLNTQKAA